MKEIRGCGSWSSPISSSDLVRGALRLAMPRLQGDRLFWLEGRPSEGGRQVVMVGSLHPTRGLDRIREASPAGRHVRSHVHEYGGGDYAIWGDRLFFVDDADGQIHGGRCGGATQPLTRGPNGYADLVASPDGRWLVAVEECPRENAQPQNQLIAIRLVETSGPAGFEAQGPKRLVAAGHDFYASPCFASSGDQLAFLAWDHPNMPWQETVLETVAWGEAGADSAPRQVAGGQGESLFQPRFGPRGELYVVSDRSGWWNLARVADTGTMPIQHEPAEMAQAQWVFGLSRWAFLDDQRVLGSLTQQGRERFAEIELKTGRTRYWPTMFSSIGGIEVSEGWATCLAGSPTTAMGLYVWRLKAGVPICVRESTGLTLPEKSLSVAEAIEFDSTDGRKTHAFVYQPTSDLHRPLPGERVPLLVKTHGGPTAATSATLDPRIQYWTSRGFAVADVNYGGSTGYGRDYRESLAGAWGVVDVEDCVAVARGLVAEGLVDPGRLAISGGSAGGFTALCALTFHDLFRAGASHYGIGDLEALVRDTHKFESRYTDWLVGPYPEERERYRQRSPVHYPERIDCPVIFFQGLEDRVAPANQAEAMVAALAKRGVPHAYVPFKGEGHGFRRAAHIRTALDGELYFYSQVFGFEAPRPEGVKILKGRLE
ncbi:MAG: S9 family peptidase [Myxococcota bacterium]